MGEHAPRAAGRGLILLVAAVALAQSLLAWGFNYWQKDFVDALSNRQAQAFYFSLQLLSMILLAQMILSWLHDTFQPRLTNWLRASRFSQLAAPYFGEQRFLTRLQMAATAQHDPAQRLVDDLRDWAGLVVQLASGALGAVAKLLLFRTKGARLDLIGERFLRPTPPQECGKANKLSVLKYPETTANNRDITSSFLLSAV